jgi:hypothetical protein
MAFGVNRSLLGWKQEEVRSEGRLEKTALWGASQIVPLTEYYYGNQLEEDEMDGASGTHGRDEKCVRCFDSKMWKEEVTYEAEV